MEEAPSADLTRSQKTVGRVAAIVLIICAVVYGFFGLTIEYSFSSDPIGPRGFPVGLATILFCLGVWYWLHPGQSEEWPERAGQFAAVTFILVSAASVLAMDWIGFVPAMMFLMAAIARLFGASWLKSAVNGVVQSLLWWLLFGPILGGSLPKGPLGF